MAALSLPYLAWSPPPPLGESVVGVMCVSVTPSGFFLLFSLLLMLWVASWLYSWGRTQCTQYRYWYDTNTSIGNPSDTTGLKTAKTASFTRQCDTVRGLARFLHRTSRHAHVRCYAVMRRYACVCQRLEVEKWEWETHHLHRPIQKFRNRYREGKIGIDRNISTEIVFPTIQGNFTPYRISTYKCITKQFNSREDNCNDARLRKSTAPSATDLKLRPVHGHARPVGGVEPLEVLLRAGGRHHPLQVSVHRGVAGGRRRQQDRCTRLARGRGHKTDTTPPSSLVLPSS